MDNEWILGCLTPQQVSVLVSGTGLWCLCNDSSPLCVGCLDCQMPESRAERVLGLYA